MTRRLPSLALLLAVPLLTGCVQSPQDAAPASASPYVDQLDSEIRGMTADEIRELREGAGAGFARAAELNGYPGPRHVLDLADDLALTHEQRAEMQRLYDAMNAEARAVGARVLDLEAELEREFREGTIDEAELDARVEEIARERAALRGVHMRTHLVTVDVLTHEQVVRYNELRGYGGAAHAGGHDPSAHGHG